MAITLRDTTPNNTGKGSELTYLDMDTNLESFYYSSSLAGGNLTLFTTGSVSHTINLGSATGAQGAPGTNGAQGAPGNNGNNGTPGNNGNNGAQGAEGAQGAPGNVASQGAQGDPGPEGAQGAPGSNGAQGDPGTAGAQGAEGAQGAPSNVAGPQGAPGAGGTPGGSNTHVQFNKLGAFGGDTGLTYVSASQILTVDKSTTPTPVSPNIFLLGNSSTAGALSGVIAGSATISNVVPASIQFKNAVTHGVGDFGTDVLIKTAFSDGTGLTVERTAVNFTASGDTHFGFDIFAPNLDNTVQENVVGFNSTTGKFTYFSPENYDRPSSATTVVYDIDISPIGNGFQFSSIANGNPTVSGKISTNSATAASVTTIKVNKTGSTGTIWGPQLLGLAPSSSFELTQAGGGTGTGIYRIVQSTDQSSYVEFNVVNVGTPTGTYDVGNSTTVETILDDVYYEYFLSSSYNRLAITNNGNSANYIRFKADRNLTTPGTKVILEASIAGGSQNVPFSYGARSGSVAALGQVNNKLFNIGAGSTAATILLDTNDVLVAEFLCWGSGSETSFGLVPSIAMQVFNN